MPSLRFLLPCLLLLAAIPAARGQEYCDDGYSPETEDCVVRCRLTWKQRWDAYWQAFETHRIRVNHWPDPFVQQDRELVREPLRQMAENGWKEQNTFANYLFAEDGRELNYAGRQKLRLTLTQLPPHRRVIFVLEGETPDITAARVASVYRHMADIGHGGSSYPVFSTAIVPRELPNATYRAASRAVLMPSAPSAWAGATAPRADAGGGPSPQ